MAQETTGTTDLNSMIAAAAAAIGTDTSAPAESTAASDAPTGGVRIQRQSARTIEGSAKSGTRV